MASHKNYLEIHINGRSVLGTAFTSCLNGNYLSIKEGVEKEPWARTLTILNKEILKKSQNELFSSFENSAVCTADIR